MAPTSRHPTSRAHGGAKDGSIPTSQGEQSSRDRTAGDNSKKTKKISKAGHTNPPTPLPPKKSLQVSVKVMVANRNKVSGHPHHHQSTISL
jgi:hypothetical protein